MNGSGSFNTRSSGNGDIRHFDCRLNKIPDNFAGTAVKTGFYSYSAWKRCKCEYGRYNSCKDNTDKWNICGKCTSKWVKGCCGSNGGYYYSAYKDKDCGGCGDCAKCYNACYDPCRPCSMCGPCNKSCPPNCCKPCCKPSNCPPGCCKPCCKPYRKPMKAYVGGDCDDCCRQVAIVYREPDPNVDCDNIVEMSLPGDGSKARYLAKHFSPQFIKRNRFQCATVPTINACPGNLIDNMNQYHLTESDQRSLTMRGVRTYETAKQFLDRGELTDSKHNFMTEMNVCGRVAYNKFGNCYDNGSTETGLTAKDQRAGYFSACKC